MERTGGGLRTWPVQAVALLLLLVWGAPVLIPLLYALLLALVLHPMVAGLERRGWPRSLAIGTALLLILILVGALLGLLAWQVSLFMDRLPAADGSVWERLDRWVHALMERHHEAWWYSFTTALPGRIPAVLGSLLNGLFGMAFNAFIIPVYTALLLYNRRHFVAALAASVPADLAPRVPDILAKAVTTYARFISGMVRVYLIVGVLNSVGFLALGVPYAVLFGLLTAIMTMIPYVGILFSSLLPIALAYTTTGSLWMPIGVITVLGVVQYLEANLIFPKVVGERLGLSTLASLVVIFAGGALWGVAGMILLLPLVSLGVLVAEDVPALLPVRRWFGGVPNGRAPAGDRATGT
ncbi:MAG TPA: AI-2E family transporter [Flavobacteriales bacterium]|nr:AI-2E family transporter [Flavobacteriales bacterium]HMR28310.1 AI-2E family transporter [Flavobacteriales bacterium]